jgi:hypothetical protein
MGKGGRSRSLGFPTCEQCPLLFSLPFVCPRMHSVRKQTCAQGSGIRKEDPFPFIYSTSDQHQKFQSLNTFYEFVIGTA